MGELRKNQFTRRLKSCNVVYTANRSRGQPDFHALRVIAGFMFTNLANGANFLQGLNDFGANLQVQPVKLRAAGRVAPIG
ncbi:hypothetical protein [Burkholderia sp. Bp9140]|uniref:hypothetical protein n=1 Tax=Burkholderia sp. Bp9140 TaxID=2184572 RepID=UPI001626CA25|nr:hypothetical protein [Burkholderia sp. Bp9140]